MTRYGSDGKLEELTLDWYAQDDSAAMFGILVKT